MISGRPFDTAEEKIMITTLTARYTRIDSGYMGQIIEWPEVVTEGKDLEDCRASLRDALEQMTIVQRELGKAIPQTQALVEPMTVESP